MRKFRIGLPPSSSHRSAVFAFGGMAVLAAFAWLSCDGASGTNASGPSAAERFRPDHIVVVILENRSFQDLVGARDMPYLNTVVAGSALMTNAYAHEIPYRYVPPGFQHPLPARPSQTNYLPLFAGHNQMTLPTWFQSPGSPYLGAATHDQYGTRLPNPVPNTPIGTGNSLVPASLRPFTTPSLGAAVIALGRTYASYSESLPHPHFDGEVFNPPGVFDGYSRKHNPGINWINLTQANVPSAKQAFLLPIETNLGFEPTLDPADGKSYPGFAKDAAGRPRDFSLLPTVSLVIPNNDDNVHSGSKAAADSWLAANIRPYAEWAKTHNSLLVITVDEDGSTDTSQGLGYEYGTDRVLTLFWGPEGKVLAGQYSERVDHMNVLATLLDLNGLLPKFISDFSDAYFATADTFRAAEARRLAANLRPIVDIFGAGPALLEIPFAKAP